VDLQQNIGSLDFWLPFYQEKGKCPSGKEEKNTTALRSCIKYGMTK